MKNHQSVFLLEKLEPRLLFSADLALLPVDGTVLAADQDVLLTAPAQLSGDSEQVAEAAEQVQREVIFVDVGIDGYQQLLDDIQVQAEGGRQFETVLLDSNTDGITQISNYLNSQQNISAVHIISHGSAGEVVLGDSPLNLSTLDAYAETIESWQNALTDHADLLFYGCNLTSGEAGQSLISSLALLTGADVAASNDVTGSAILGGDWDLEYETGVVDADLIDGSSLLNWHGLLGTITVTQVNDVVNAPDLSTVTALNGADGGDGISLREAIIAANNNSGVDDIILGPGTYLLSIEGTGEEFSATGDLDISDALTITGAGADTTIIDAAQIDRVFEILSGSGNVNISGVTITNGYASGGTEELSSGGGIRLLNGNTLTITDSEITNNTSVNELGGGIYNIESALILNSVTLSGNSALEGAAVRITAGDSSIFSNVTIAENWTTEGYGGGIYTAGTLTIINSTIVNNDAGGSGGGIEVDGTAWLMITNSILANNTIGTDTIDPADDGTDNISVNGSGFVISGYNIDSDGTANLSGIGDQSGSLAIPLDVKLDSLGYYGGSTRIYALLADSPAIDAGTNLGAPTTDQRGYSRPVDGDGDLTKTVDIGAYELSAPFNDAFWLTTVDDVSAGGQSLGIDTWDEGDLIQMTDPSLAFAPSATNGTFSTAFDIELFGTNKNIDGVHYVTADILLGTTNTFQLLAGDLLLTGEDLNLTGNSASPDPGFFNSLNVKKEDVFIFRPDTPGDYSVGSFAVLLENPLGTEIWALSLIEKDTVVGDITVGTGDFIFSRKGGEEENDIWLYTTGSVGISTTSGTAGVLIEGDDPGVRIDEKIYGLDLIETTTTIGGRTLTAGTILVSVENEEGIGAGETLAVTEFDVFALEVTKTTLGSGSGHGLVTPSLFFTGADVAFDDGGKEALDGFTLTSSHNQAPVITLPSPAISYTIGNTTKIDAGATADDVDSADLDGGTLSVSFSAGGTLNDNLSILEEDTVSLVGFDIQVNTVTIGTYSGGTAGADLVIIWNESSAPADIQTVLRQVAYNNNSGADTSTRTVDFALSDGDGGTSAVVQQSINYFGVVAPVLTLPNDPNTYIENGSVVIVDAGATVTDIDSPDLDGGTLTVSISTNSSAADIVSILPGGGVTLDGNNVEVGGSGNVIGTFSGGTGGADLVITWGGSSNATPSLIQDVLRQIAFSNSSENPNDLTRTLTFTLTDGDTGSSLPITQQVIVNSVNDQPSGTDTTVSTLEETAYTFTSADFGFSDSADNDAFNKVKMTALPLLGTLTNNSVAVLAGDLVSVSDIDAGLLAYTPPLNGSGTAYDSFTFQVQDTGGTVYGGVDLSTANTMTINVVNTNDAPTATNMGVTVLYIEDTLLDLTDITISDVDSPNVTAILTLSDAGAGALSVATSGSVTSTFVPGTGVWMASGAIVDVNTLLRGVTFTPTVNYDSPFSIATSVGDGVAAPITGMITVNSSSVNDAPAFTSFVGPVTSGDEDSEITITFENLAVQGDEADVDGTVDAFVVKSVQSGSLNIGTSAGTATAWIAGSNDTLNATTNGYWTPDGGANGILNAFEVVALDNGGSESVTNVTVQVTVNLVNDEPTTSGIANVVVAEDAVDSVIDLFAAFADVEDLDSNLIYTLTVNTNPSLFNSTDIDGGAGTLTLNYADNQNGTSNITVRATDTAGLFIDTTFAVTVNLVNDAPVAGDDTATVNEAGSIVIDFTGNDSDADNVLDLNSITVISGPGYGSLIDNGDGTLTYTHNGSETSSDSFTYTIDDVSGATSNVASVAITVNPVNDAPTVTNLIADQTAIEDTLFTFQFAANTFNDADGDTLTYTSDAFGWLSFDAATRTFSGTPLNADIGTISVTVSADDGNDEAISDTFDIVISNSNDAPTAITLDNLSVDEFSAGVIVGNLSTIDADAGDTHTYTVDDLRFEIIGDQLKLQAGQSLEYAIDPTVNVTITSTDGEGLSTSQTFPITVNDSNVTPTAMNDNLTAIEDNALTITSMIDLLANDSDADGDSLSITTFTQPTHGILADHGDGTLTYTPDDNFSNTDSFNYTLSDGRGGMSSGTAFIYVEPVGDTPQVVDATVLVGSQTNPITISRHASDGAEVTHFRISAITGGTLYLADGVTQVNNGDYVSISQGQDGLRFTPVTGADEGSFQVESSEDGVTVADQSGRATSSISVTVLPNTAIPEPDVTPEIEESIEEIVEEGGAEEEEAEIGEDPAEVGESSAEPQVPLKEDGNANADSGKRNSRSPLVNPILSFIQNLESASDNDSSLDSDPQLTLQTLNLLLETTPIETLRNVWDSLDIGTLSARNYDLVRGSFDALQQEVRHEDRIETAVVSGAIATTMGLSAGYVVWMLKGGSLLASLLSSMPAWHLADPLSILSNGKLNDDDDESLEAIIKKGEKKAEEQDDE